MPIASTSKWGRVDSVHGSFPTFFLCFLPLHQNEALHKTIKPSVLDERLALFLKTERQINDFSLQRSLVDYAHSTKTESTMLMIITEGKWRGHTLLLSYPRVFLIKIWHVRKNKKAKQLCAGAPSWADHWHLAFLAWLLSYLSIFNSRTLIRPTCF